jgi:hypothetical protein
LEQHPYDSLQTLLFPELENQEIPQITVPEGVPNEGRAISATATTTNSMEFRSFLVLVTDKILLVIK